MILVYKPKLWSQQSQFQQLVKGQLKGLNKMMLYVLLIYMLGILPFSGSNKVVFRLIPLWKDKFLIAIKVELK